MDLWTDRPLSAESSALNSQEVDRCVNRCPHTVHREALEAAPRAEDDCGITALIGIVAAAAALTSPHPPLPAQGLVLSDGAGITFIDLRGRRLGHVDGMRFATEYALSSGVPRFRDGHGRLWSLDVRGHRLIPAEGGLPLARDTTLLFARRAKAWLVLRRGRIALRMSVEASSRF
jgi:hypothetical protein